ncbi:16S rRNA (guanine(527)-N(7))-methyltransferase RsmG [Aureimonas leprariae]|uniref:Ribosomal RNA small subunit methyltransferase G n=1 Tax=Plantimonas leprariae TaxID=2615207 RepID=A0A7V7TW53_9HYPH|nr:16S rRNA (guanine(527)-N(7))-methyltransferase RsmG [Aureimonas leprariae]KAB0679356.1 16S rRNA (guanine(527)-N(7))-methyltransferase RsmG [Aureimonas leprariae]
MPPEGRDVVLAAFDVSRETRARLDAYVRLLGQWQRTTNLVADATMPEVWERHVADSLQFRPLCQPAKRWVDLGSGGGFPGLVTAILVADEGDAHVDLVESNGKKAAFLRTVIRELGLPATVHAIRIEAAGEVLAWADAVSARALASLGALLGMVAGRIGPQVPCFFAKGRSHGEEIVDASRRWRFTLREHPSRVAAEAAILEVADIRPRTGEPGTSETRASEE